MVSEKRLKELGVKNWPDLAKDFVGADLLLGNGFSINLAGHFNYKSLFEEFLKLCEPSDRKIFSSFKTNNFERIQEILIDAKRVNELFKIGTNQRIDNAIELLKNGLIQSIRNNHPIYSKIDRNQLQQLSIQLNNFGDIFTLNYDLFLYHIIMQMKDESDKKNVVAPYSDYFWGGEPEEQFKQFMDYEDYHPKHVYYLHGALFLFNIPPDTLKLRRRDEPKELVVMIGDVITNNGVMPLFVSEGKYKEKLETIKRSNYLSFCYEALEKSANKLVIFGSSLSGQDAHIANAINYKKNKRELAISIHIGNKSEDELEEEIKRLTRKFKSHKIYFFDSETIFNF
jgi:hypothetical protein